MAIVHKVGDKVRVKAEPPNNSRGVLVALHGNRLVVRLHATEKLVRVRPEEITNFSLAARKAWKNMPDRRVGRPLGSKVCDRVSVTIRVDRTLWDLFRLAEQQGFISDRTQTINRWLREQLRKVAAMAKKAS